MVYTLCVFVGLSVDMVNEVMLLLDVMQENRQLHSSLRTVLQGSKVSDGIS